MASHVKKLRPNGLKFRNLLLNFKQHLLLPNVEQHFSKNRQHFLASTNDAQLLEAECLIWAAYFGQQILKNKHQRLKFKHTNY
jgi:hypothetical protein